MRLTLLFLIVGVIVMGGCTNSDSDEEYMKIKQEMNANRPKGVPKGAFWEGGLDGGSYMLFTFNDKLKRYYVKTYNDFTGDLDEEGFVTFIPKKGSGVKVFRFDKNNFIYTYVGGEITVHSLPDGNYYGTLAIVDSPNVVKYLKGDSD